MNAEDEDLERSSESCERWSWGCGGLIAVGVMVEVVIAAINPAYGSFWERWGSTVADALIALGVGGEIMFGRMGYSRQKELTRRSNELLAGAIVVAEEGRDWAEQAQYAAAEANSAATEAHLKALEAGDWGP